MYREEMTIKMAMILVYYLRLSIVFERTKLNFGNSLGKANICLGISYTYGAVV